jgi:hypothetical protein
MTAIRVSCLVTFELNAVRRAWYIGVWVPNIDRGTVSCHGTSRLVKDILLLTHKSSDQFLKLIDTIMDLVGCFRVWC